MRKAWKITLLIAAIIAVAGIVLITVNLNKNSTPPVTISQNSQASPDAPPFVFGNKVVGIVLPSDLVSIAKNDNFISYSFGDKGGEVRVNKLVAYSAGNPTTATYVNSQRFINENRQAITDVCGGSPTIGQTGAVPIRGASTAYKTLYNCASGDSGFVIDLFDGTDDYKIIIKVTTKYLEFNSNVLVYAANSISLTTN